MLHLKNKSTWLILGLTIQGIALFCLVIIVIQTKSKSDLINKTYLGNLMGVYRVLDKLPDILYRGPTPSTPLPQYQLKISRKGSYSWRQHGALGWPKKILACKICKRWFVSRDKAVKPYYPRRPRVDSRANGAVSSTKIWYDPNSNAVCAGEPQWK